MQKEKQESKKAKGYQVEISVKRKILVSSFSVYSKDTYKRNGLLNPHQLPIEIPYWIFHRVLFYMSMLPFILVIG